MTEHVYLLADLECAVQDWARARFDKGEAVHLSALEWEQASEREDEAYEAYDKARTRLRAALREATR